ncbi:MAG TPA: hypothetical protein VFN03_04070 [Trueperaceae bacterium]|nr:hypothetical protein [Trueperaceae bacterium]
MIHQRHDAQRIQEPHHRLLRLLVAPVLTLALVACATTDVPHDAAVDEERHAVVVDARSVLDAMLSPSGEDSAALAIAALPAPVATSTRTVPSLHAPGVTDTVSTLAFGDVTIEVYRPGAGTRPLLSSVRLDTDAVELDGLRVGMSLEDLYQRLGRPVSATADLVAFRMNPAATTPYELSASLRGDVVTTLRWSAYLD